MQFGRQAAWRNQREGEPEHTEVSGNFATSRNDAKSSLPGLQIRFGISDNVLRFLAGKQQ